MGVGALPVAVDVAFDPTAAVVDVEPTVDAAAAEVCMLPVAVDVAFDATAVVVDVEPTADAAAVEAAAPPIVNVAFDATAAADGEEAHVEFAEVELEVVVFPPSVVAFEVHTNFTAATGPGGRLLSQVLFR